MKDLHTKKYKMLLKEIKKGADKSKDNLCSWTGRHCSWAVHTTYSFLYISYNLYQHLNDIFADMEKKS